MQETVLKPNEYLERMGEDLSEIITEVYAYDVPKDEIAPLFIYQIESRIKRHCRSRFVWNGILDFSEEGKHQVECFKQAVIAQIEYSIEKGKIWIDANEGQLVPRSELIKIQLANDCEEALRIGGMYNYN